MEFKVKVKMLGVPSRCSPLNTVRKAIHVTVMHDSLSTVKIKGELVSVEVMGGEKK